jgi:hypothetical protein
MANTLTNVLPKLLATGLRALRENAVMSRLVNRSYSGMAAQRGNVINVPIPSAIAVREITAGVTQATNVDSNPTVALVTLDQWYESAFHLSDNDFVSESGDFRPMQASEAIKSLVNQIDKDIIANHVGLYGAAGTAGTTPFATVITPAIQARTKLNEQLAPMDDRRVVLDPAAEGNALGVSNILQYDQRGDQGGIIRGSIGHKLGMDFYMSQNITQYSVGTAWATGWTVATGGATLGNSTITMINSTATGTVNIGDIFTLAGDSQQYVITAVNSTVTATTNELFTFYPALATTYSSGDAATVVGTDYVPNLVFHRDCFAFASRPLMEIQGLGSAMLSAVDPVSGVALRLELSRQFKQTTFSYDALWGSNVIRRELGAKIFG